LNKLKPFLIIIFLFFSFFRLCIGQDIDPGPGYQMMMINNPALAGTDGEGNLRLSYLNYYPGNSYNLNSVYFSYDSYFPVLHGGAAMFITNEYEGGIINDVRGGLSYSYYLKAGKDLFINAGLSASVFHRGYNFKGAVLPDQIDPVGGVTIPSSETLVNGGKTVFDIGAGFLVTSGNISGGFSVNHLAEPDLSSQGESVTNKLKRKITAHVSADFDLKNDLNMKLQPLAFMEFQDDYLGGGAGAAFSIKYLAINLLILGDNGNNLNIQSGFSLVTGRLSIFYNYRFNIVSGNSLMPFSLLHQTGLAFSLNKVDKRNIIKTINFPKM
jgi:type IX secretion system PorP/SprF family membrane protein